MTGSHDDTQNAGRIVGAVSGVLLSVLWVCLVFLLNHGITPNILRWISTTRWSRGSILDLYPCSLRRGIFLSQQVIRIWSQKTPIARNDERIGRRFFRVDCCDNFCARYEKW